GFLLCMENTATNPARQGRSPALFRKPLLNGGDPVREVGQSLTDLVEIAGGRGRFPTACGGTDKSPYALTSDYQSLFSENAYGATGSARRDVVLGADLRQGRQLGTGWQVTGPNGLPEPVSGPDIGRAVVVGVRCRHGANRTPRRQCRLSVTLLTVLALLPSFGGT